MLEDIAALAYLDYRAFANGVRSVRREPKRLMAWALYGVLIGNAWLQRSMQRQFGVAGGFNHTWLATIAPVIYALLPGGMLALLGYGILASALRRRPKIGFTTPADGRFLCGSRMSPRVVAGWLQFRSFATAFVRWPLLILIFVGFPGFAQVPVAAIFAGGFAILIAMALNWQASNASALLSRISPLPWIAAGAGMLLAGVAALAVPAVAAMHAPGNVVAVIVAHGVSLPPGSWLVAALEGHRFFMVPLLLLALAAGAVATTAAGDCYPEMWQTSARLFVLRRIARRGAIWQSIGDASLQRQLDAAEQKSPASSRRVTASAGDSLLAGGWTILWKDWIGFIRAPVGSWGPALRVGLIVVASAVVGLIVGYGTPEGLGAHTALVVLGLVGIIWFVQILALTTAAIAVDLRMPIWSLSVARLPLRLLAWTVAASWRPAIACALALGALGIAGGVPAIALAALPAAALLTWSTRVVGLAAFTILPNQGDVRGPGAMLRVLMIYVLMAPPAIAGIVAQVLGGIAAAVVASVAVLVAECGALLFFASTRLEGNAMAYAAAGGADDRP